MFIKCNSIIINLDRVNLMMILNNRITMNGVGSQLHNTFEYESDELAEFTFNHIADGMSSGKEIVDISPDKISYLHGVRTGKIKVDLPELRID